MKTYRIKCRKDNEYIDQKKLEQKIDQLCNQNVVCEIKKSRFIKEQEAKGLLSNLGIKTPSIINLLF